MKYALGIDIGGTKIAAGLINQSGEIVKQAVIPTEAVAVTPEKKINQVISELKSMIEDINSDELIGIGIGAPGPLNGKEGVLTEPPNLRAWWGAPIKRWFKESFSCPVIMENDANAAVLAEKWLGAGQGCEHFIYMTISTGIGAGIYSHGRLLTGAYGNAGEVGHIVIDPAYGTSACGQKGTLEWIASGTAIARQATALKGKPMTSQEVFEQAAAGDQELKQLVDKVFEKIGVGCVTLINLLEPERIVLGGGVTNVGEPLFSGVKAYVEKFAISSAGRNTEIVPAMLHQNAGLLGAAALILHQNEG
ncbi:ROK family protein [Alkalicoccobacillus porphyridii]|uniref:ROK family protein n=1 Tax=Alkalicoccobacillus porphyridii TaxID=2597270 RepID=A0A553ZVI8_9BACI|nr:ROK family protein [Alkalicoccobacillus porphyridii]TSB45500.1 ROK family protein [Alkalicoccobacillus porphyridii]